jgi:phosphohistidine phosphatase SixA
MVVFALVAYATVANAQSTELRGEELMKALRGGGYTILLRHARTDWSVKENVASIPVERSGQRNLSADGVRDAGLMGLVFKHYQIPIGEIVASPMFRARETAEYAAGTPTVSMALRVFPTTDETAALVAAAPKPGTNRLLVTHHFVIEKLVPGINPGDIAESEAAIVRPTGDGRVSLVGRIKLPDWEQLLGVAPQSSAATPAGNAVSKQYVAAATVSQSASSASAAIPDTPAGKLARMYLEAFNSPDSTRMRAFIEQHLLPNPTRTTEARMQSWRKTFETLGALTVAGVRSSSPNEIVLDVRSKGGDLVVTTTVSAEQPDRAASITISGTIQGAHP